MAVSKSAHEKGRLDLPEIQKLIRMIEKSPITELEFEDKSIKIRISKNGTGHGTLQMIAAPPVAMNPGVMPSAAAREVMSAEIAKPHLVEFKSPMVGTFYRASGPDADPYIRVGDSVEPGTILCIVEAMKLMNELECDIRGRISEICVENAQPVEFGQTLFKIDTSTA